MSAGESDQQRPQDGSNKAPPTLADIEETAQRIAPFLNITPVHHWAAREIDALLGDETEVVLKLELFQRAGSFKARGALVNLFTLSAEQRRRGVTAVSAGNHAVAVAYAASVLGIGAKVVMLSTANPARIAAARAFGAEVVFGGDGPASFALAEAIATEEGRAFIHPFEGEGVARGTGTLGLEFARQAGSLDALIVAVGGGGLAGGVSTVFKAVQPDCRIYGVEPAGADGMARSFETGGLVQLDRVETIADSLGAPMTLPYSYGLCRAHVDELVRVDDDRIAKAAALLFRDMKLAVEPACAAGTAALTGPLAARLRGKRVGVILCGSIIDAAGHAELMRRAESG